MDQNENHLAKRTTCCKAQLLPSWTQTECDGILSMGSSYSVHVHGKQERHMVGNDEAKVLCSTLLTKTRKDALCRVLNGQCMS
jgi:hypothetical protein